MSVAAANDWALCNQGYLTAALALVADQLERHAAGDPHREADSGLQAALDQAAADLPAPSALESLCAAFRLSAFERDLLLLCAGMELDAKFPARCGARRFPTFGVALAALPGAHWSALTPAAPLRYWHVIEVGAGESLVTSPLIIDERILHYLAGVGGLDARLAPLARPLRAEGALPPSLQAAADQATRLLQAPGDRPVIQLCGSESAGKRAVTAAVAAALGAPAYAVAAADLPRAPGDRERLARLWQREAALTGCILLAEDDDRDAAAFAARYHGPLLLARAEPRPISGRDTVRIDVDRPLQSEQPLLWQGLLGRHAPVDRVATHFRLSLAGIRSVGAVLQESPLPARPDQLAERLWAACREQARPRLDDLARRVDAGTGWDDLVLPDPQLQTLREMAAHVRQRHQVYAEWGFGAKGARGLGISALFAGGSGTGKTLAAEVLANELQLDLYQIDLSQVVSKYIGETEKNLRRVFETAEEGGAVLLFDEADALFGKRSEVKDSHDRYANIEVGYLLQRMESYHGLAILTTNMKSALDAAFLRRIRFVVPFPFPDAPERAAIWRRVFPAGVPTEGLDPDRLAQLHIAGGHIRNIALGAAFLAADAGEPVRMAHLLRAAQTEYAKLEKPLTAPEIRGWQR